MNKVELRDELVERITRIIASHQLQDYGSSCMYCKRELYGTGGGTTLSRHRAERIVDEMGLVDLYTQSK